MWSFAAVLSFRTYVVFALAERKNDIQIKLEAPCCRRQNGVLERDRVTRVIVCHFWPLRPKKMTHKGLKPTGKRKSYLRLRDPPDPSPALGVQADRQRRQ